MQNEKKNIPQVPPKGGHTSPVATSVIQSVYLRIAEIHVLSIPDAAANLPPTLSTGGHLYLIEGTINAIGRYAGATVDWLIKIAHLICDPLGGGRLYTHPGDSSDWYDLDRTPSWHEVVQGNPLLPAIYEFVPAAPILISKIGYRQMRSATTTGSESSATTFRTTITRRDDAKCVMSETLDALTASRLIPKRLGSDGAREVVTRFCGESAALGIHRFDPRIGILLFSPLDTRVDDYKLGFYHVTGNTYTLHNFDLNRPNVSIYGTSGSVPGTELLPHLHLYPVVLSAHDSGIPLPPTGVFDWHYLQCVIKMFGTQQYNNVPNIAFHVLPFKTVHPSDDDSGDDDSWPDNGEKEPPYPTFHFDQFVAEQWRRQKLHEEVTHWSAGVSSGI